MRHRKSGIKLNRTTSHRDAMFKNMVTSLLKHERIHTTDTKAKELRKWADRVITLAKRGDLHARRQALSIVREKDVVHKLFADAADRFGDINGGYTRIVKIGHRPGDAAPISLIELVSSDDKAGKGRKKAKKKAKTAPAAAAGPKHESQPSEDQAAQSVSTETSQAETQEEAAPDTQQLKANESVSAEVSAEAGSDDAPEQAREDADSDKDTGSDKKE